MRTATITRSVFILLIALALFACEKKIPQQEGWTRWRGPSGDGTIRDDNFKASFIENENNVKWRTMIGVGYSGLCVSNNRIYTMGRKSVKGKVYDVVYSINSANGKIVWTHEYAPMTEYQYEGPRAMPVVSGDRLYTLGADGDMTALDIHSGKKIWAKGVARAEGAQISTWGISGTPVIENGVIYLNVGGGMAIDEESGKIIWKGPSERNGYATPVLFDYKGTRAVMLFSGNKILLLNAADGKTIASRDWVNQSAVNAADPVIFDDQSVLVSSSYRREGCGRYDFSGGSFEMRWVVPGISTHFSSLIEHEGLIYGIHGDTNARGRCAFTCLDPATGEVVWSQNTAMYGSLIKVNDTLIYLNENGMLFTVEPCREGFKASKPFNALIKSGRGNSWVAPSYWKGHLYLRSNTGELVCIQTV